MKRFRCNSKGRNNWLFFAEAEGWHRRDTLHSCIHQLRKMQCKSKAKEPNISARRLIQVFMML